jgi:hypothetical protein
MQTSVKHRRRAATPETATSRLIAIGCDIVAAEAGRSLKRWHAGVKIRLRNGRWMHSNSNQFREELTAEFARRFGEEPSPGAVTRALGFLNRQRFKSTKATEKGTWALETLINGEAVELGSNSPGFT